MKNTAFQVLTLALATLLCAFSTQDERAAKILKESKSAFDRLDNLSAKFKYSIKASSQNAKEMVKEGELKFKKKKPGAAGKSKYYVKTAGQEMFCNGSKIWVYMREDNEVNELSADDAGEAGMDVEGIFKLYEQSADARYEASENIGGVQCDKIYLAIKNPKADYNQAYLWIGSQDHLPRKALLIDRRQTRTTLELKSLDTKKVLPDNTFTFDKAKYPGVKNY